MEKISSILCFIICSISIPLGIVNIIEENHPFLFLFLVLIQIPGYLNSIKFLFKKYSC